MKLKPIKPKYKNKYVIEVTFMHGDADAYSTEDFICDGEEECKTTMDALDHGPMSPGEYNDDDYNEWALKVFKSEDFIPGDSTCDGQFKASLSISKPYFYDENGVKFEVEF